MLINDDCKRVLVAVDWLTQPKLEEILGLLSHEDSYRRDLVLLTSVRVQEHTADPKAGQIVVKVDPKVPWRKLVIVFPLLGRGPLAAIARERFGPLLLRIVVAELDQTDFLGVVIDRLRVEYLIFAVSLDAIVQLVELFLGARIGHNLVVSIECLDDAVPNLVSQGHICVPVAILVDFNLAVLDGLSGDAC